MVVSDVTVLGVVVEWVPLVVVLPSTVLAIVAADVMELVDGLRWRSGDVRVDAVLPRRRLSPAPCGNGDEGLLISSPGVSGTLISNSVPRLGPDVSARVHIRSPPSFRAMPFATIKPRPRPSLCLVKDASSCENGWNRRGRNAAGIPGPESTILMTT